MKIQQLVICSIILFFFGCESTEKKPNISISVPEKVISDDFSVPTTISIEAQEAMSMFSRSALNSQSPKANDIEGWNSFWEENEKAQEKANAEVMSTFNSTIVKMEMGGVPVLDIKPKNWINNGKVLIYIHGGAYTLFSASSTLTSSIPVAEETGLRVISVDYTVAPNAQWKEITDQVVLVIRALLNKGYTLEEIAIFGDSAGGGLASGAVLKARDEGIGLIGAVVLWSPWSDITMTGDTYISLKETDPVLSYENVLVESAKAYASVKDQKKPYVSPVYADYKTGFPPTLIQVGSKEIFLSNAIRHYQALDGAGIDVKIDPYEGMWHVFQAFHWKIPEADIARKKMGKFLEVKLGYEKE